MSVVSLWRAATATVSGYVSTVAQNFGGLKTFNDGLKLDDDVNQSTLNYYRTEATSGTLTGGTTSPTVNAVTTREGNVVTFTVKTFTLVTKSGAGLLTVGNLIPSWAVPGGNLRMVATTRVNGNDGAGMVAALTNGNWSMGNNGAAGSFNNIADGAVNCGLPYDITMSWVMY